MSGEMRANSMDISVVIPAYNAGRFITRCLQSVNAQTLRPKEVIVVDDGSTDNTAALAGSMGARVVHQKNLGVSAARNNGIRRASSEWIAFLDADDLWLPDKLERQAACVGPDTVLAYTGHRTIDDHGVLSESTGNDVEQARRMVRHRSPFYTSTVLAKRDVLLENGGFREGLPTCEDWEMWAKIILKHGAMDVEPSPLVEYYVHPDSSSADP
jgi:glycosyltransferase involved in cell wall biosynthesis